MDVWIQEISMLKEQIEEEGEKKENLKEKLKDIQGRNRNVIKQ